MKNTWRKRNLNDRIKKKHLKARAFDIMMLNTEKIKYDPKKSKLLK